MASTEELSWGTEEYTPLELIEAYKERFPLVVQVKDGYCGDNPWECLSQSEVLRIHCVEKQQKVVVRNSHGRYYSIPATYPARFHTLEELRNKKKTKDAGAQLSELLKSHKVPFEVCLDALDLPAKKAGDQFDLQRLTVKDTYEERYMKANLIQTMGINRKVFLISGYVKATLVVSRPSPIEREIHDMATKSIDFSQVQPSRSILVFSTHMLEQKIVSPPPCGEGESVYESLVPDEMISAPSYEPLGGKTGQGRKESFSKDPVSQRDEITTAPWEGMYEPLKGRAGQEHRKQHDAMIKQLNDTSISAQTRPENLNRSLEGWQRYSKYDKVSYQAPSQRRDLVEPPSQRNYQVGYAKEPYDNSTGNPPDTRGVFTLPRASEPNWRKPVYPVKPNQNNRVSEGERSRSERPDLDSRSGFPSDISEASMEEICHCLKLLHMEKHCEMFRLHLVDGPLLMQLEEKTLVNDLGLTSLQAKTLVMFCGGWRPK